MILPPAGSRCSQICICLKHLEVFSSITLFFFRKIEFEKDNRIDGGGIKLLMRINERNLPLSSNRRYRESTIFGSRLDEIQDTTKPDEGERGQRGNDDFDNFDQFLLALILFKVGVFQRRRCTSL